MGGDYGSTALQVFTPPVTSPVVTISVAANVTVSDYKVICFQDETKIHFGSDSGNPINVPAFFPLGIEKGQTTIYVYTVPAVMLVHK